MSMDSVWLMIRSWRRSHRSASTPPYTLKIVITTPRPPPRMPSAIGESVVCTINHDCAYHWKTNVDPENIIPVHSTRKSRCRKALKRVVGAAAGAEGSAVLTACGVAYVGRAVW